VSGIAEISYQKTAQSVVTQTAGAIASRFAATPLPQTTTSACSANCSDFATLAQARSACIAQPDCVAVVWQQKAGPASTGPVNNGWGYALRAGDSVPSTTNATVSAWFKLSLGTDPLKPDATPSLTPPAPAATIIQERTPEPVAPLLATPTDNNTNLY
jgi:hypothetical protein